MLLSWNSTSCTGRRQGLGVSCVTTCQSKRMARPGGPEPPTVGFEVRYFVQKIRIRFLKTDQRKNRVM